MKKLLSIVTLCCAFNASAQEPVNLFSVFESPSPILSDTTEQDINTVFIQTRTNDPDFVPQSAEAVTINSSANFNFKLLTQTLPLEHYNWRHLSETNQLETAFIPEFKIGFSEFIDNSSAYYSLGFALIRPSENSMAYNTISNAVADNQRSTFLSLSIHSRF